jgi:hypothetical protein
LGKLMKAPISWWLAVRMLREQGGGSAAQGLPADGSVLDGVNFVRADDLARGLAVRDAAYADERDLGFRPRLQSGLVAARPSG